MPKNRLPAPHLGDLSGRRVIVTGASSGLGLQTAAALGRAGARVILAVRNPDRGEAAAARLRSEGPRGAYVVEPLDLSDLSSVHAFARRHAESPIDILVNNAGISRAATRGRRETPDGFETILATNFLGHFALTGLLLDALRQGLRPRVVSLGSQMANLGRIDLNDLQLSRRYSNSLAYANSKLAMVVFGLELNRRSQLQRWGVASLVAHPGWASTNIFGSGRAVALGNRMAGTVGLLQSAVDGAQAPIFAAASRHAVAGTYYGPVTKGGLSGPVGRARVPRQARSPQLARGLWQAAEELTGVAYGGSAR